MKTTQYKNEFNKENYAFLKIFIPKQTKQPILDHLQAKGYKSLNSYIQALISADLGVSDLSELLVKNKKETD